MARRNKGTSGVRGPNSALTEFLRTEGITEAFRQRRARQQIQQVTEQAEVNVSVEGEEQEEDEVMPISITRRRISTRQIQVDEEEQEIRNAARRKRRAAQRRGEGEVPGDSDDDNDDADYSDDDELGYNRFKKFNEEDTCVDCDATFIMTVYSRYVRGKKGYLCDSCNELLKQRERNARRNQLNARKKRKKLAQALLDKTEVKLPTLQDICIKKITENINDVDILGDIGQVNMNKISRILSKNRSLNDSTMTLFLTPTLKSLEFWDCSNVDSDSFNKIASYCPNVESLTLFMCGQLHNDNLKYYKTNLKKLTELSLNGPFLISDQMWQEFFEECGSKLTKFEVRNTHRFGNDSLISLLENSGANLKSLKLSRLDGLDSAPVYELIPHYIQPFKLTALEISYPLTEELISDDLLINILSVVGESLTYLNVDGCSNLTDKFLLEGVMKFCPNLTHLSMNYLDQLTADGFTQAFHDYSKVNNGGLINVSLVKCTGLNDKSIYSFFNHSASTLVELNLNAVHNISKDFLLQILTDDSHPSKLSLKRRIENSISASPTDAQNTERTDEPLVYYNKIDFPLLTTLDISFVRAVDDEILGLISNKFSKLTILEVFGNNRCTSRAKIRQGLLVIGRQSDLI